jgi:hypothetical protein
MAHPLPVLAIEPEDARGDVHQQAVERLRVKRLWHEIAGLPPQQRDAVVLREFAGLSYEDIAAALGVTTSAVESLLFRARGRLRTRMRAVLAALDLGGIASGTTAALARLLSTGGAPLAVKAAAVGVGVTVVGGGGIVSERVLAPDTHRAEVVMVSSRSRAAATVPRPHVLPLPTTLRPVPVRAPPAVLVSTPPAVPAPVVAPVVEAHERQARDRAEPAAAEDRPSPKAEREPVVVVPEPVHVVPTTTGVSGDDPERGGTTTEPVPPPPTLPVPVVVAATTKSGEEGDRVESTVSTESTTTATTTTAMTTTSGSGDSGHDGGHDGGTTTGQTTTDGGSGGSGKDGR